MRLDEVISVEYLVQCLVQGQCLRSGTSFHWFFFLVHLLFQTVGSRSHLVFFTCIYPLPRHVISFSGNSKLPMTWAQNHGVIFISSLSFVLSQPMNLQTPSFKLPSSFLEQCNRLLTGFPFLHPILLKIKSSHINILLQACQWLSISHRVIVETLNWLTGSSTVPLLFKVWDFISYYSLCILLLQSHVLSCCSLILQAHACVEWGLESQYKKKGICWPICI